MRNLIIGSFPDGNVLRLETIRRAALKSKLYLIFFSPSVRQHLADRVGDEHRRPGQATGMV